MAQFVLLLKHADFSGFSPEEMQKVLEKYLAWADKLRKEGRHRGGEELDGTGAILQMKDGQIIDGPFTETKEAVGGYFVIEAKDYEEAKKISRECPHLAFNGVVEIREIIPH
jgi:hypothetical protein